MAGGGQGGRGRDVLGPASPAHPWVWIHQCGSVEEALEARKAGADAVIAQGREAGGHVRGSTPALVLLREVLSVAPGYPVLAAGGIATAEDVRTVLDAGAAGAVAGTRFLLARRAGPIPTTGGACGGANTVLTELFGAGWAAAPHRVVANAATRAGWGATPVARHGRAGAQDTVIPPPRAVPPRSEPHGRLPGAGRSSARRRGDRARPASLAHSGPLYAGETVDRIDDVRGAAELTRDLAP